MNTEIYFFSGTGNSYSVAATIAHQLDASLLPVVPYREDESVTSTGDTVGIVFPIYDFKAPELVKDFVCKLKTPDSTYFFGVCTYGVTYLNAMKKLEEAFNSAGKELSGGFAIKAPHSGLGYDRIPAEKQKEMYKLARKKCTSISSYVRSRKRGTIETSSLRDRVVLLGLLVRLLPGLFPMFKQALFEGWDSLGFYADEKCNGCRVCERVCPMDNITMGEEKPTWGDNCINCFACFHWCPRESIQIANLTGKMERRHHPEVRLVDLIEQKHRIFTKTCRESPGARSGDESAGLPPALQ